MKRTLITLLISLLVIINYGQDEYVLTDQRDQQTYDIIELGDNLWFAQDLRYNNDTIGTMFSGNMYYNWHEASADPCPAGWHVATHNDWLNLRPLYDRSRGIYRDFPKEQKGVLVNVDYQYLVNTDDGYYHAIRGNKFKRVKFESRRSMVYMGSRMPRIRYIENGSWKTLPVKMIGMSIRCVQPSPKDVIIFESHKEMLYVHHGDPVKIEDFFGEYFQYVTNITELDSDAINLTYIYSIATNRVKSHTLEYFSGGHRYSIWVAQDFTIDKY